MKINKRPRIFVVGNEKGGAGKTTCSIHLIVGLLELGYKVASIDVDSRQHSLTSYLKNRENYNLHRDNSEHKVAMPLHFHFTEISNVVDADSIKLKVEQESAQFSQMLTDASQEADYIIIDTPGSYTNLSRIAHSYADTVITPINDSFVDLDVMVKLDEKANIKSPSIYSQMLWEQKMQRAARDQGSIEWFVVRNRLNNLEAQNKKKVEQALLKLAKRISFKVIPGFTERVIFRELFPQGLTLLDLKKTNFTKTFSLSHVAARQELRNFLKNIAVSEKLEAKN